MILQVGYPWRIHLTIVYLPTLILQSGLKFEPPKNRQKQTVQGLKIDTLGVSRYIMTMHEKYKNP